ncbi:replication-associated protein [Capybara virus 19_cap1_382]|nr:replication-associated protein [Capybara virus 19_cap1_382]
MSKLRNCVFTINCINGDNDMNNYFNYPIEGVRYLIYQHEKVSHDHIQGYIEFDAPKSMAQIKGVLGQGTHIEKRRGSAIQAKEYCQKSDSRVAGPYEFGVISNQGKRSDMVAIADRFRNGETIRDIIDGNETQFVRYGRGLKELQALLQPRPKSYTRKEVVVLWGPPGVGKSYFVHKIMEMRSKLLYIKSPSTKWWDNYQGETDILLDEFPGSMTARDAKIILGEVNGPLETKGGSFTTDRMERFWITSNYEPETWFENARDIDRAAVKRRITDCAHIDNWAKTAEIFYKFCPPPLIHPPSPVNNETQNLHKSTL